MAEKFALVVDAVQKMSMTSSFLSNEYLTIAELDAMLSS